MVGGCEEFDTIKIITKSVTLIMIAFVLFCGIGAADTFLSDDEELTDDLDSPTDENVDSGSDGVFIADDLDDDTELVENSEFITEEVIDNETDTAADDGTETSGEVLGDEEPLEETDSGIEADTAADDGIETSGEVTGDEEPLEETDSGIEADTTADDGTASSDEVLEDEEPLEETGSDIESELVADDGTASSDEVLEDEDSLEETGSVTEDDADTGVTESLEELSDDGSAPVTEEVVEVNTTISLEEPSDDGNVSNTELEPVIEETVDVNTGNNTEDAAEPASEKVSADETESVEDSMTDNSQTPSTGTTTVSDRTKRTGVIIRDTTTTLSEETVADRADLISTESTGTISEEKVPHVISCSIVNSPVDLSNLDANGTKVEIHVFADEKIQEIVFSREGSQERSTDLAGILPSEQNGVYSLEFFPGTATGMTGNWNVYARFNSGDDELLGTIQINQSEPVISFDAGITSNAFSEASASSEKAVPASPGFGLPVCLAVFGLLLACGFRKH